MHRPARLVAFATILLAVILGGVGPAMADVATDRIREFFASVNRVIADPAYDDRLPERLAAMRGLVVEIVDFGNAAAVALGPEWAARTPGEREEFVRLFADLLQTSVFSSVGARARIDNGLTVTYVGELGDRNGVTVATSVLTRSGREMAVGYRMTQRQGGWMVHDVVIDGVSLVDNYRAQFQTVIQRSSYAGLVIEMRARIADLGRSVAIASAGQTVPAIVTAAPTGVVTPPSPAETIAHEPAPIPAVVPPAVVVAAAPREPTPAESRVTEALETPRPVPTRVAVAAAAVAPQVVTPRVAHVTTFWVQIGAFRNVEKAMQVVTALRDHAVSLITTPAQPLMRVLVGPFTDRNAAASKLREIRARGYAAFIAEAWE